MERPANEPIDQRVIALYDDFTHSHLDRRLFMERLTKLVGSAAAAAALIPVLRSNYALAEQVKADDPRLATSTVTYPGSTGPMTGYLARPTGTVRLPAIIVIHQNRGLNPHIRDIARRVALNGYVAIAPDLMASLGGTPENEDEAMAGFTKLQMPVALAEALKTRDYLKSRSDVSSRYGIVGFCWGGGLVNLFATAAPDLGAAVVFYGLAPPLDKVAAIKAPIMMHYAGLDDRINATRGPYEEALKKAGIPYTAYIYDGVNHAFNDDTGGARYNEQAARFAWQRTMIFFDEKLKM